MKRLPEKFEKEVLSNYHIWPNTSPFDGFRYYKCVDKITKETVSFFDKRDHYLVMVSEHEIVSMGLDHMLKNKCDEIDCIIHLINLSTNQEVDFVSEMIKLINKLYSTNKLIKNHYNNKESIEKNFSWIKNPKPVFNINESSNI